MQELSDIGTSSRTWQTCLDSFAAITSGHLAREGEADCVRFETSGWANTIISDDLCFQNYFFVWHMADTVLGLVLFDLGETFVQDGSRLL